MSKQTTLLTVLGVIVMVGAWYALLFSPSNETVAALNIERDDAVSQQVTVEARIAALERIRRQAPEIEAELAAARTLLPTTTSLPAIVRQLQDAADQSGVTLSSITPKRPTVSAISPEISKIEIALTVEGSYHQWVDLLRRVENPDLIGRGVMVRSITLAPSDYPSLIGSFQIVVFSRTYSAATTAPQTDPLADAALEPATAAGGLR